MKKFCYGKGKIIKGVKLAFENVLVNYIGERNYNSRRNFKGEITHDKKEETSKIDFLFKTEK